ncbi:MAG: hypothetical protein HY513_03775 [Candidatus Aenigmarchaeota archaeon]|nr:hypothetical protein [Candidatus Aenigmarchaeota archaeon]
MAHITLSIPDEIYREMKNHPEIKWSEVARDSISKKLLSRKKVSRTSEIKSMLKSDALEAISSINEKDAKKIFNKQVKEEWKHAK